MKRPYAARCRNLTGIYGPISEPGSPEWMQTMSASKVAAVLGLSPYMSRFTLWHQMAGTVAKEPTNDAMRRGHYLEPAIRAWLADQITGKIVRTGTWTHPEIPWATATPDGLAFVGGARGGAQLVEIKSASNGDEWGASGTDEIPAGYRAQIMWQLFVTGATYCRVGALLPFLEFRQYQVKYDRAEAEWILEAVREFMDSLSTRTPPPLDGAESTYQTVRQLHPEIDDVEVEVPYEIAADFLAIKHYLGTMEAEERASRAEMLARMGSAKRAVCNGVTIATRAAKSGGTPYLSYPRTLPTLGQITTEEIA